MYMKFRDKVGYRDAQALEKKYMKLTLEAKSTFKTYIFCQYYWSFYCKFYFFINKTLSTLFTSLKVHIYVLSLFFWPLWLVLWCCWRGGWWHPRRDQSINPEHQLCMRINRAPSQQADNGRAIKFASSEIHRTTSG